MIIQLIIIQAIAFVIIIVFLKKLLYTETAKESDRLKKLKDEYSIKESQLQARTEAARKEAEEKILKAEEDARRYGEAKEKEAETAKQEIVSRARDRADEMVRSALNSREKIREEIELQMKEEVPAAAARIFKEALPQTAMELVHNELVHETAGRIRKLEKGIFSMKERKGELLSPQPLKKSEKEKIVSAVSERAGREIDLVEKEDKTLIAGIVVKLGSLVIDGSLENKLRQVGERLS